MVFDKIHCVHFGLPIFMVQEMVDFLYLNKTYKKDALNQLENNFYSFYFPFVFSFCLLINF